VPDDAYNPLEKSRLAASVAEALLTRDVVPLGKVPKFDGAGIYAIYYTGDAEDYKPLADANRDGRFQQPIYVGKAIPKGGRKGGWGLGIAPGPVLVARLRQHARTIEDSENLDLADFACRYLVVDDVWIPLAESMLIEWFRPLWNVVLDGFGNHNPGKKRFEGQRPAWDTVHPGRSWAAEMRPNNRTAAEWHELIHRALEGDESAQLISVEQAVLEDPDED